MSTAFKGCEIETDHNFRPDAFPPTFHHVTEAVYELYGFDDIDHSCVSKVGFFTIRSYFTIHSSRLNLPLMQC